MNKNIFVTRLIPGESLQVLRDKGFSVDVFPKDRPIKRSELIRYLKRGKYGAVICLLNDKIDAQIFDSAPSVKLFANYASGFDNIEIKEASLRGIKISNAPTPHTSIAVAEHTFALVFALEKRLLEADRFVRNKKYKGWSPTNFIGSEISDKTLGLVGAGQIGACVAKIAKSFGMRVVYYDIKRNDVLGKVGEFVFCDKLDDLLKISDIVSIHTPLNDSTKHLINRQNIFLMKKGSILINTSRGAVVEESALVYALKSGIIKGAGLDVFEFEPEVSKDLLKMENIVLTPHIASATLETRDEMSNIVVQNILDFFEGRPPRNIVN